MTVRFFFSFRERKEAKEIIAKSKTRGSISGASSRRGAQRATKYASIEPLPIRTPPLISRASTRKNKSMIKTKIQIARYYLVRRIHWEQALQARFPDRALLLFFPRKKRSKRNHCEIKTRGSISGASSRRGAQRATKYASIEPLPIAHRL